MLKKSLIAAAALASVVTLAASTAQADPRVHFGISIGDGYGYPGFYEPSPFGYRPHHGWHDGYYPPVIRHGMNCSAARSVVREAGFSNVRAYDCSAPVYGYKAWRHGDLFKVKVTSRGDIVSVRPLY